MVLKSLNDSSNINEDFLNEWKVHLQCQNEAFLSYACLIPVLGITQDPDTLNYMIVIEEAFNGSLRNNLLTKKYNPNDKFKNLWHILRQLKAIHKLNLVHGDLHNGNILHTKNHLFISDLGLCKPVNRTDTENEIYGIIPYMAPEILRGKPYTKAADIYSFGMLMWEMTSGAPAFHNISHDIELSLNICTGTRPEIIEGTMPEYVKLMKRCWDNDPQKRPTVNELENIFSLWMKIYPLEKDNEKRIPVPENEPEIVYHPKSCYTSRKFDDSAKLNEICELSNKILFDDNVNQDFFGNV
ncbi:kinase-like domain-containing protein [Rhizophagus diaphanus]|nr:kinase-like domain-containing protein [Rhizophagus diaphanus] [Rhizophagus sp. MUCL 43196]